MKTLFKESFLNDIEALEDSSLKKRIREAIARVEKAVAPRDIRSLKRLKGGDQCYRIKVGDYRLGLTLQDDAVVFVRCLHRKDISQDLP